MTVQWKWCRLDQLALSQAYALFALREAVFVVEQRCAYQELDGYDLDAWHLVGRDGEQLVAALRVLGPGVLHDEPVIGRVLVRPDSRGRGVGHQLMTRALHCCGRVYPGAPLRLSAQTHLQGFYARHGFAVIADPHDEDGIPHVAMRRPAHIGAAAEIV